MTRSGGPANKYPSYDRRRTVRLADLKMPLSTGTLSVPMLAHHLRPGVEYGEIEYGGVPVNYAVFIR